MFAADSFDMTRLQDSWALMTVIGIGGAGLLTLGALLTYVAIWAPTQAPNAHHSLLVESEAPPEASEEPPSLFSPYSASSLPTPEEQALAKYGKQLVEETFRYLGPKAPDPNLRYAGNRLACKNCHLDAGLKPFSAPYVGVTKRYPNFRSRENRIGTIEQRINGCMERSMNGRPLPEGGREMRAIVAYMNLLSERSPDGKGEERGFVSVDFPERAVDLERGKEVFAQSCATCHGPEGRGKERMDGLGYRYPPVAGPDSYNTGAGMHRVLTAMAFVVGNMPLGATVEAPFLAGEDAYDVAGYLASLDRPEKPNTELDFPDRKLKPLSTPYPPYADDFSPEQHKYGPFGPLRDFYVSEYGLEKTK